MTTVLVVGGAGYIGSHMVRLLDRSGYEVIVLDNLSTGYRDAVQSGDFVEGDLGNRTVLSELFGGRRIDAVMHFAASCVVEESVRDPAKYYRNNVVNTLSLLEEMLCHDVRTFMFSSTAAVYGDPIYVPVDEAHPLQPMNPYGASKAMVERIVSDLGKTCGLRFVSLRYFNAAGADPEGGLGQRHEPVTHLIPNLLQSASARKAAFTVYGRDYPTPDGTCIRDYIHVTDLCWAHLLALKYLSASGKNVALNLGNGAGYSVQQVLDEVVNVTNRRFKVLDAPRRAGDPAQLIADASLAKKVLGWEPKYGLEEIIAHAWAWERKLAGA